MKKGNVTRPGLFALCGDSSGFLGKRCNTAVWAAALFLFLTLFATSILGFIYYHQSREVVRTQLNLLKYKTLHESDEVIHFFSSLDQDLALLLNSPGMQHLVETGDFRLIENEILALCRTGRPWDSISLMADDGTEIAGVERGERECVRRVENAVPGYILSILKGQELPYGYLFRYLWQDPSLGREGRSPGLLFIAPVQKAFQGKRVFIVAQLPLSRLGCRMPFAPHLLTHKGTLR